MNMIATQPPSAYLPSFLPQLQLFGAYSLSLVLSYHDLAVRGPLQLCKFGAKRKKGLTDELLDDVLLLGFFKFAE